MSKPKSGLADSPFFHPIYPTNEQPHARTSERASKRTAEPTNGSTDERVNTRTTERTDERTHMRTPEQANARTSDRKPQRYSFNFYLDQIEALKRLQARKQLQGERINLSDLARKAFDDFLDRTT